VKPTDGQIDNAMWYIAGGVTHDPLRNRAVENPFGWPKFPIYPNVSNSFAFFINNTI
jgi:hypothetical protein